MQDNNADALIPVALFSSPVWRALKDEDGKLKRIWPEYEMSRSQDLPKAYYDAGQFYWFDVDIFINKKKILAGNTAYLELNWSQVQDIDTLEDWKEAEYKYQLINKLDISK
jgi:N-acylneuraminate cytidylyltransferase